MKFEIVNHGTLIGFTPISEDGSSQSPVGDCELTLFFKKRSRPGGRDQATSHKQQAPSVPSQGGEKFLSLHSMLENARLFVERII